MNYPYQCRKCNSVQDRARQGKCYTCQSEDVWPLIAEGEELGLYKTIQPRHLSLPLQNPTLDQSPQCLTEFRVYDEPPDRTPHFFITSGK